MSIPRQGITADRKTADKMDFIVDNYEKLTCKKIAEELFESPRWIKRQIQLLKISGKLNNKREPVLASITEQDWPEGAIDRAIQLRKENLKSADQIVNVLYEEFDFKIASCTLGYWMRKFECPSFDKKDWLDENFNRDMAEDFLSKDYRIVDIVKYLQDKYNLYFSDDLILRHLNKMGLDGQKVRRVRLIKDKSNEFSKEWLEERIFSHDSILDIASKMGVSKTIVMHRIKEEGLELIRHRIIWSKNLETLKDLMLARAPLCEDVPPEDFNQMMLGWILGDGHLDDNGRFVVAHSLIQLDYLYLKYQVLRKYVSTVSTVPQQSSDGYLNSKEKLALSCPGFGNYKTYLNENGTKNYIKILSEMSPLGWACYFMDDGSYFSGSKVISMSSEMAKNLEGKFIFGDRITDTALKVKDINEEYLIPGMIGKLGKSYSLKKATYWRKYLPELFSPDIKDDFTLSFFKKSLYEESPEILNQVVKYFYEKGFPVFSIYDDYLKREWTNLIKVKSKFIWKNDSVIKNTIVGNSIFKHFMSHFCDAKYKGESPRDIFNNFYYFCSLLKYTINNKKSVLPDYVYDSLIFSVGGTPRFPCGVAKAIADRYSPEGGIVVDPCSGWGERLLGVTSAGRKYYGFEPWDKSYEGLRRITDFLEIPGVFLYNENFNKDKAPSSCDLIFTSPPYIDFEICGKPFSEKNWNMLIKSIFQYAETSLKTGGYLILNIPQYLKSSLPTTSLKECPVNYWNTTSRRRSLDRAEHLYIWQR